MVEYRVKGAFFENDKASGPRYTGFVEIDGVRTNIALWPKVSAKGDDYLQVSEKKPMPGAGTAPRAPAMNSPIKQAPPRNRDMDDDIPF